MPNSLYHTGKTTAPTVNEDSDAGYLLGDRWLDETNDKEYVCLDVANGAAVWTETTQSGAAEVNDLSAAVTWANIPDANVPESAVTQHAVSKAGATMTGAITPPNNAAALQSPTRSHEIGFWDGYPAFHDGFNWCISTDNGVTLGQGKRFGWSSTDTGGSAWRDTALERESSKVIVPYQDDTHDFGSPTKRWDDIYATNTTIQSSDERLKDNINDLSLGTNLLRKLRPVSYKWRDYDFTTTESDDEGQEIEVTKRKTHTRLHAGFIAQEFKTAIESLGIATSAIAAFVDPEATGKKGPMGVRYTELIPVLVNAFQELDQRVAALEA